MRVLWRRWFSGMKLWNNIGHITSTNHHYRDQAKSLAISRQNKVFINIGHIYTNSTHHSKQGPWRFRSKCHSMFDQRLDARAYMRRAVQVLKSTLDIDFNIVLVECSLHKSLYSDFVWELVPLLRSYLSWEGVPLLTCMHAHGGQWLLRICGSGSEQASILTFDKP